MVKDAETSDIWEVHIDPADFVREDGGMKDRTEALITLERTYGLLLAAAEPERYADGYEALVKGLEAGTREIVDAAPGSSITRKQKTLPELADAFAMYVLAEMPVDSPGSYQECVRYFYQFEELNTYRSAVRIALGLQTEE